MSFSIGSRAVINETIAGEDLQDLKSYCTDKNYLYVVDQQNGSYSNQVSWDLTSAVSQNAWMSLQEGYILMPFCTSLTWANGQTNPVSAKAVCLKDSFLNYVDSLQLFVNGKQLIDQTTFSNIPLQILDKLTMGVSDLKLEGSALNISPDTATSIRQTAAASSSGDGITNNLGFIPNTAIDNFNINYGIANRVLNTWSSPTITTNQPTAMNTITNNAQILAPYFSNDGTTKKAGTWNYVVYLPLRRLSDLLRKYPLIKGSQVRLVLNFNASTVSITEGGTTPATYVLASNPTMTAGNTVTAMLTDTNYGLGTATAAVAGAGTLTTAIQPTTVSLVSGTTPARGFPQLPNCRIYLPTYKINPTYEERLLANRVQTVKYLDWYQQPIVGISSGQAFSQTLTTALPNVACLIMVPFQNGASGLFANATCSQFQSPFDTAPATTLPGGMNAFQNFNVQVSGQNVFNLNQNYGFDNWVQEVQKVALNAGLEKSIASGLVDFQTWLWSPYVVCDLTDRAESANDTYQSVVVSGTNSAGVKVDYYCFIGYYKTIKVDTLTGDVEKIF
jgi:hypothetical protein